MIKSLNSKKSMESGQGMEFEETAAMYNLAQKGQKAGMAHRFTTLTQTRKKKCSFINTPKRTHTQSGMHLGSAEWKPDIVG